MRTCPTGSFSDTSSRGSADQRADRYIHSEKTQQERERTQQAIMKWRQDIEKTKHLELQMLMRRMRLEELTLRIKMRESTRTV
jgi:hypothetical protein